MSKKLLLNRIKLVLDNRSLSWPPEQVSKYSIKCSRIDDQLSVDLDIDDLVSDLYDYYPDYKRQKVVVLKSLLHSIFSESLDDKKRRNSEDTPIMDLDGNSNTLNTKIRNSYKRNSEVEKSKHTSHQDVEEVFIPETNIPTRLKDVGGIDKIRKDIEDLAIRPLKYPHIYKHLGVQPTKGILLHGPPGSGKSKLAEAIAGEVGCPFYRVPATEIITGMSGESENRLRLLFEQAKKSAPSIIFLDELDAITPKRENAVREMEKRIVSQLGLCIDGLYDHFVIVIGATNRQESVDPMIRRNGRFDREISMGIPNLDARSSILKALSNNIKISEDVNFDEIAHLTPGFVGADLQSVTREAGINCISRIFDSGLNINSIDVGSLSITRDDFVNAISKVQPSAKREGFATIPDVTWNNIGALSHLRKEMEEQIVFPIKFKNLYKKFGVGISTGILLYGPPGCGKTLLAKAVSNECKANFISVKGPELLNKYVGESERAVRLIFQRASISAPCVIFFDEVDSLCSIRNSESNQVNERVVNQLLTEMDGIQNREYVYIIAATNRPDIIDPAMLRPGRLEKLLYVPLPDKDGRIDILKKITTNLPLDPNIDFEQLSNCTNGYSGADLACLVREAGITAVEEIRNKICTLGPINTVLYKDIDLPINSLLTMEHFNIALSKTKPSVKQYQIDFYKKFNKC